MYIVPGMKLIPQQKNMSCWYASAMMLIEWKRNRVMMSLANHPDPSQVPKTVAWEVNNNGIMNPQVPQLAKSLGLATVPPMSPSMAYLRNLLEQKGPLWTNGKSHIVVIAGIDENANRLYVYDPAPVGVGKIEWRGVDWYVGNSVSSRDTSRDAQAVFLYHP